MTLKIQVGIENKALGIRLTPIDQAVTVPDLVGDILLVQEAMMDAKDIQPLDGEYDVSLSKVEEAAFAKLPTLKKLLESLKYMPGEETAFIRITRK